METILLNGKNLTIDKILKVAKEGTKVEIAPEAMELVKRARKLVFQLAEENVPVYGLNRGVGWNKDKKVFSKYFEEYNRNLIYAHCVAAEPEASEEQVRAIMLVRLNTLLLGYTGIQPEIVNMYKEFLNHRIHPVLPLRGSVGEADIANLSHIGLAMIGEGEVYYNGVRMEAYEALKKAGLKPIVLGPKDGLAMVSSNALSAGLGALVLDEVNNIIEIANLVCALTLEGIKGNITPLDEKVNKIRGFSGQNYCAGKIRDYLDGSYLWRRDITESLQDPLSIRCACAIHGAVKDSLEYVWNKLINQLNSTDDNPCVLLDERKIISCCNFEPMTWVLGFEMLGIALSHLSRVSCNRTIKMANPSFTELTRFLTPSEGEVIAYGTIQKTFASLDTEIRHLSNPATVDYLSLAGDIEDHANNSPFVVRKVKKIVDNLRYILGIEALHAVQAIDLRKKLKYEENIKLGKKTKDAYEMIRGEIPFLDKDRNLTEDIKKIYNILKSEEFLELLKN
ncbi:HAL/PAL/TAL family ammonia-lyase [Thermohalobacter berrensis]|uniref:Phenylalanine ammonia-lyase n=1 Tax=Thermohalobacter berrensis TaxID=99594 RepID=A0A419T6E6_9FIRM|nr:aromatic amino acid ammonia-lyase [Thermohalobacter berrensis]RKD32983.1 phenylalanine ammonia-lyase [Thermohalobacter berrensis]